MSVSQTIKTRAGIKRFVLPATEGDVSVLGFTYLDKKTEVHLLKRECAPLQLEENTLVALSNCEQLGSFLLAVTPNAKQGKGCCLTFRAWDLASVLGFTPKEVQIEDADKTITQDGKFRGQVNLIETVSDFSAIKIDSLDCMLAIMVESEVLIWEIHKTDSGMLSLHYFNSIKLKGRQNNQDITLLQANGVYSISIAETGSICSWNLDKTASCVSKSISIPSRANAIAVIPEKFQRLSQSSVLFSDDFGQIWIFCVLTNSFKYIKLPGCSGTKKSSSLAHSKINDCGILASCSDGHTINLFHLSDSSLNPTETTHFCERPFKALFSSVPVNALMFISSETLAVASCSNRSICFWAGLISSST